MHMLYSVLRLLESVLQALELLVKFLLDMQRTGFLLQFFRWSSFILSVIKGGYKLYTALVFCFVFLAYPFCDWNWISNFVNTNKFYICRKYYSLRSAIYTVCARFKIEGNAGITNLFYPTIDLE